MLADLERSVFFEKSGCLGRSGLDMAAGEKTNRSDPTCKLGFHTTEKYGSISEMIPRMKIQLLKRGLP